MGIMGVDGNNGQKKGRRMSVGLILIMIGIESTSLERYEDVRVGERTSSDNAVGTLTL